MQIQGPSYLHGAQPVNAPHGARADSRPAPSSSVGAGDELQLSTAGQFVDRAADLPPIREDRVAALRAAIAGGAYETADKLDKAVEGLLDELA